MDNTDLSATITAHAEAFRRNVANRFPFIPIREALHRGKDFGRYVAIAARPDAREYAGIFTAEFRHTTQALTMAERILERPAHAADLPEPLRTLALDPDGGLITLKMKGEGE